MNWLIEHWDDLLLVWAPQVIAGASALLWAIAKITPSDTDNKVAGYLDKAAEWLAKIPLVLPVKK